MKSKYNAFIKLNSGEQVRVSAIILEPECLNDFDYPCIIDEYNDIHKLEEYGLIDIAVGNEIVTTKIKERIKENKRIMADNYSKYCNLELKWVLKELGAR